MRILYLDCFSGISGDMAVGALTDLGIYSFHIRMGASKLDLGDCHLHFERQTRGGISGVKFDIHAGATHNPSYDEDDLARESDHVLKHTGEIEEIHEHSHHDHGHPQSIHEHAHHEHEHFHYDDEHTHHDHGIRHHDHGDVHPHGLQHHPSRNFSEIRQLIDGSELSGFVKQHSTSIFQRIANAESKIHGASVEEVQFHEVSALDSIVDVVLSCIGIEALQVERIYFSSLIDGKGSFRSSHGVYPLPAPAVLEILQGIPIRQADIPFELITPTGAAIVAEFHDSVGVLPEMRPRKSDTGWEPANWLGGRTSYVQSSVNWKKRPPPNGLSNSRPIWTIFRRKSWERSKTACSRRELSTYSLRRFK